MNPPPNPNADAARRDIAAYSRPLLQNPPPPFDYYLTWPATQPGVCCIDGQWRRNEQGEIEAWYSAEQLRFALNAMKEARK